MICSNCNAEYNKKERIGKPGLVTHCNECAEEEGDVQQYTGNMIWSHKTAPSIQINKDPKLTAMLNGSIEADTTHKSGSVLREAETFNYKGNDK
jgi:hypothetical protein